MSKTPARSGVPAFAGLRSFITGQRAEDAPKKDDDEEARAARRAEEDKNREDEDARRAEEDDRRKDEDARRAEEDGAGEGDEDDKKDGKKGKKAKADQPDDEECDEEDDPDAKVASAARAGRLAERARWISALNDPAVTGALAASACVMLATTDMHSSAVVAAVGALPPAPRGARSRIDERMSHIRTPPVGSEGGSAPDANSAAGQAAAIILAGKKRRGEA